MIDIYTAFSEGSDESINTVLQLCMYILSMLVNQTFSSMNQPCVHSITAEANISY